MRFAEVAVNVPIRRQFGTAYETPPPESELALFEMPDPGMDEAPIIIHFPSIAPQEKPKASRNKSSGSRGLQSFHYHLPPELESIVEPGHLVWVPFGHQELQGIVLRLSDNAPVQTKAIQSLARPNAVLNQVQLDLAEWIANRYIAPFNEALKLFLPPGLLSKNRDEGNRVRAKRELKIELLIPEAQWDESLLGLGRTTQQSELLTWLYHHPNSQQTSGELIAELGLRSMSGLEGLAAKSLIVLQPGELGLKRLTIPTLAQEKKETWQALLELQGVAKYIPLLEVLAQAQQPLWKSELYARVDANLKMLQALESVGLIQLTEEIRFRDPLAGRIYAKTTAPHFTDDQEKVWRQIEQGAFQLPIAEDNQQDGERNNQWDGTWHEQENGAAEPLGLGLTPPPQPKQSTSETAKFLLHGVTGSGKTEIFLRAIDETLAQNKQAIVLVPEIALTPQTVARFAGRFPGRVTVIHSGLNQGERYDVWRRVQDDEFDIVIGPRSALFAPLKRLGLIIMDEEHESSYKQNAEAWGSFTVFYDARDVANRLAELTGSVLILGSATPSLESYYRATNQASTSLSQIYTLLEMPRRVMGHGSSGETLYAELPPVELVDMRQELRAGNRSILSRTLQAELHATLDRGEQAILFLNRRGTRTFVMCRDCGEVSQCDRCDVPLTYHERADVLVCHHCNRRVPIPEVCPECNSKRIKYFGSGTQRLEELVAQIAPRARVLRWDADTTGHRGSHEEILSRFTRGEADIIVGTQMIAKGLDLPMVTLVGVIAADSALYLPDFRSAERTFQLLTQVAGRAGRSELGGQVIIQSYTPEHYAIQSASQHDFQAFYDRELRFRKENGYPPMERLLRLVYWDKKLEQAEKAAIEMATTLRHKLQSLGLTDSTHRILGPAPAFFPRFRGYYRWQVIIKSANPAQLLTDLAIPFGWRVDVDPISLL
ncbi:MAG: primosomal protein N' [Chloroflexota bacterium]